MHLLAPLNLHDACTVSATRRPSGLACSSTAALPTDASRWLGRQRGNGSQMAAMHPPLLSQVSREVDSRSLYASPFPFDATLDALSDFFRQHGEGLGMVGSCWGSRCWHWQCCWLAVARGGSAALQHGTAWPSQHLACC